MELFHNRVTCEYLATFNFDGSKRKSKKSKALEKCNMSPTANYLREYALYGYLPLQLLLTEKLFTDIDLSKHGKILVGN